MIAWVEALAPEKDWREAYPVVRDAVCEALQHYGPEKNKPLSTTELVERLYPVASAIGPGALAARARIFKALKAMATRDRASYCRRGEAYKRRTFAGKGFITTEARPWLWARYGSPNDQYKPGKTCPHCGGLL